MKLDFSESEPWHWPDHNVNTLLSKNPCHDTNRITMSTNYSLRAVTQSHHTSAWGLLSWHWPCHKVNKLKSEDPWHDADCITILTNFSPREPAMNTSQCWYTWDWWSLLWHHCITMSRHFCPRNPVLKPTLSQCQPTCIRKSLSWHWSYQNVHSPMYKNSCCETDTFTMFTHVCLKIPVMTCITYQCHYTYDKGSLLQYRPYH